MGRFRVSLAFPLVLATFAGCVGNDAGLPEVDPGDVDRPAWMDEPYVMQGEWSTPRKPAIFDLGPVDQVMVPVRDGVEIAIGVFYPDVHGCDWSAQTLPEECRMPVVMDGGPYYLDRITIDKKRPPWGDWLVPRGYIYVQMALRGTGESGGCMGYKAPQDVDDVYDVIDWIVKQPWSSGNVGMGGRSYDGTTAWAGAAGAHPALKTIIPISGAVDAPDLYFRNGTHELRALIPHIPIYWASYALGTSGGDPLYRGTDVVANVCPEVAQAHVEGPLTAFTGDASSEYWQARDLTDEILETYQGSAWVIHGLLDWNVNPSQAVPFVRDMHEAGIPTLAWLGQWAHHYPDNTNEHSNVRWDWSDKVVQWFDYYLKGAGIAPWLGVEVEQQDLQWRREATYPPDDAWLRPQMQSLTQGDAGIMPGDAATAFFGVDDEVVVAGLPTLHVDVTPSTPTGGALFAELYLGPVGEEVRIGWSAIDLRNHDGGNTDPQVLVPGQSVLAKMQFEPLDLLVPAASQLRIELHRAGVEDINPSLDPSPLVVNDVTLNLPTTTSGEYVAIPMPPGDARLK